MADTAVRAVAGSGLKRTIGFWGLTFISLGSIIGSGWLLGALGAAQAAGPASLVSWVIAAIMLTTLALVYAELGGAYPVTGGSARFPYFAFGTLAGFTAGWASWLQAVAVAPIEVEASLSYLNSVGWVKLHLHMLQPNGSLTLSGLGIASVLMLAFLALNMLGAKFLSDSNALLVIWKTAVPVLAIVVVMILSFHPSNFTAGGGFAPMGVHGIFAALALGVVFALQGFEQAAQIAGEAKNPQRDLPRAILISMAIGAVLYIMLEVAFIGALNPANLVSGWQNPVGVGDFGPYYTLALALGAAWLGTILLVDAFISPFDTGLVYIGTSARLSYALGEEEALPNALTKTTKRGAPIYSLLLAFVVGEIFFLPFPSWSQLVGVITSATAIMYAFAPVSLAALRKRDPDRPHPYKMPWPSVLTPASFVVANLIIYWSGFTDVWKLLLLIFAGRLWFEVAIRRTDDARRTDIDWRASSWIWPWLIGMTLIGLLGRYGGGLNFFPEWVDLAVVIVFSLGIFYYAVSLAMSPRQVAWAVSVEGRRLSDEAELGRRD